MTVLTFLADDVIYTFVYLSLSVASVTLMLVFGTMAMCPALCARKQYRVPF